MIAKVAVLGLAGLLVVGRVLAHHPQVRGRRQLVQLEAILVAVVFLAVFAVIVVS